MSDELVLHGRFGRSVKVQGSNIIITSGVISARNKTIPIRNISSVDIKEPGMFNGYIQFVLSGGQHLNSTFSFSGGSLDAAKDENSVVFQSSENFEIAIKIKQFIESYDSSPRSSFSPADEIRKLKSLLDEGIINKEQFDKKVSQYIDS
jgi:hypothetical protein